MAKPPVLFLIFNRPDTTASVFEAIRQARPPRLYIAADGVREGRNGEAENCAEARRIATQIDWPCELKTLFRDKNLGCKRAVSGALDWFFEEEPEGIVLEDDIVPLPSFFAYCEALLDRYRDDEKVMMINGGNLISHRYQAPESYFFSVYAHVWGWASWRRAWRHFDVTMADWPEVKGRDTIPAVALGSRTAWRDKWYGLFDAVRAGQIDTWDYQWSYALFKRGGVAATPCVNLTRNIGFGAEATHTVNGVPSYVRNAVTTDLSFPLRHPTLILRNEEADRLDELHVFRLALPYRLTKAALLAMPRIIREFVDGLRRVRLG
ncbi:MAG: hypothetical protein O7C63_07230 [Alphaproteobacteria bacterium]|nr:hypothetical protein [Alphaproteobacteria bacterium]